MLCLKVKTRSWVKIWWLWKVILCQSKPWNKCLNSQCRWITNYNSCRNWSRWCNSNRLMTKLKRPSWLQTQALTHWLMLNLLRAIGQLNKKLLSFNSLMHNKRRSSMIFSIWLANLQKHNWSKDWFWRS